MKTYNDSSWRKNPPLQGEFFVCPDSQERCYPEAWLVCQYWNPSTWKSEWDGQKWTTCPEIDIIEIGIFWHRQSAISYSMLLEELEPKKLAYNDVCFGCIAKLEHIDVLKSKIKVLQGIAISETCRYNEHMWQEHDGYSKNTITEKYAKDELAEEYPEAFDDPE